MSEFFFHVLFYHVIAIQCLKLNEVAGQMKNENFKFHIQSKRQKSLLITKRIAILDTGVSNVAIRNYATTENMHREGKTVTLIHGHDSEYQIWVSKNDFGIEPKSEEISRHKSQISISEMPEGAQAIGRRAAKATL